MVSSAIYGTAVLLYPAILITPGGIALDPSYFNTSNVTAKAEAWALHEACQQVMCVSGSFFF